MLRSEKRGEDPRDKRERESVWSDAVPLLVDAVTYHAEDEVHALLQIYTPQTRTRLKDSAERSGRLWGDEATGP